MKIPGRISFVIGSLLIGSSGAKLEAQDIHFSQFVNSPLLVNPAAAGNFDGSARAILNYKNQWTSMGNPYRTMSGSFDLPFKPGKENKAYLGGGLLVYTDQAGDSKLSNNQASLALSGILPMGNGSLSAGIQAGIGQRTGKISDLSFGNQFTGQGFDPTLPSNEVNTLNSFIYPDFGGGVYYDYSSERASLSRNNVLSFKGGLSVFHVNQPSMRFLNYADPLHMRFTAFAAAAIDLPDSKFSIDPDLMYVRQGPQQEINLGAMVRYRLHNGTKITGFYEELGVGLGLQYRSRDAVIALLSYQLAEYLFGISYDFNVSSYAMVSKARGGVELCVRYVSRKGTGPRN